MSLHKQGRVNCRALVIPTQAAVTFPLEAIKGTDRAHAVDDGRHVLLLLVLLSRLLGHQRPQLVQVDRWAPVLVPRQVVVTHADLSEVTWMAGKRMRSKCDFKPGSEAR